MRITEKDNVMMLREDYLMQGQQIMLSSSPDGVNPEPYVIGSFIGEGGSCVCYEAVRTNDSRIGRLKEFYPVDRNDVFAGMLHRTELGQLIADPQYAGTFRTKTQEYIGSYLRLNKTILGNTDNQVLNSYFQEGQILYGIPDEASGLPATVYIWSVGIAGKRFDEFLDQVRAKPDQDADLNLDIILQTVITLTDSIKALHSAGLMHLDIKPSNFLIPYDSRFRCSGHSIALFDINSLYSEQDCSRLCFCGSLGFQAPELVRGKPDYRSDIYSIGALLFDAIIISDEVPGKYYEPKMLSWIDHLIHSSSLIRATQSASDGYLLSTLSRILRRCLYRDPKKRYASCAQLLEDLNIAKTRTQQFGAQSAYLRQNTRYAIVDSDEQGFSSPTAVVQKLLHEHPLYEVMDPRSKEMNVLVVGSGIFGQKFIDQCLQAGQMKDHFLNVTAVSNTPEQDCGDYLKFRPALKRFIRIQGQFENSQGYEPFAALQFRPLAADPSGTAAGKFLIDHEASNRELISALLNRAGQCGVHYQYVFIALGDDRLNAKIAGLFAGYLAENPCPVCYIQEQKPEFPLTGEKLYCVSIHEKITPQTIHPQLEHMAFNTHLVWNHQVNSDVQTILKSFRADQDYYESSLAYALSIPYKLYSVGICLETEWKVPEKYRSFVQIVHEPVEAAELFSKQILQRMDDPEAKAKFDTLVMLEHRRWILNEAAMGIRIPCDEEGRFTLENCARLGKANDRVHGMHACLAFSRENSALNQPEYVRNHHAKWDVFPIDPDLDELDFTSVRLHQMIRERADAFRATDPLHGETVEAVSSMLLSRGESAMRAWQQFRFCLKNILEGSESDTQKYEYHRQNLGHALAELPEEDRARAEKLLQEIRSSFGIVMEANSYTDYKAYDRKMTEQIPFILTWRTAPHIAMPFVDGILENSRNEVIFSNVAAATVMSPGKLTYLYCYPKHMEVSALIQKLQSVFHYLETRNVHCVVNFIAALPGMQTRKYEQDLTQALEQLQSRPSSDKNFVTLGTFRVLPCADQADAAVQLGSWLEQDRPDYYDGNASLFLSHRLNGRFLSQIDELGIPYFEFDWRHKKFNECDRCGYLTYLKDESYFRISDMFALVSASQVCTRLPEFTEEYQKLWDLYSGGYLPNSDFRKGIRLWNRLCRLLQTYHQQEEPLASLMTLDRPDSQAKVSHYILPDYTVAVVRKLLRELQQMNGVTPDSSIRYHTSDSYCLTLKAAEADAGSLDRLFYHPEYLLRFYGTNLRKNKDRIDICTNRMEVADLDLSDSAPEDAEQIYQLLMELERLRIIGNLHRHSDPVHVSFRYMTSAAMQLLQSPDEILKVYTYYEILKTGYFDDLVCGYRFRWEGCAGCDEIDLILTKGFQSVMIRCVADQRADKQRYHQLDSIANHFGIGTMRVLLGAVDASTEDDPAADSDVITDRGNQMDILTISDPEDIRRVGSLLEANMRNRE